MIISAMNSAQTGMRRQVDAFDSAIAKAMSSTLNAEPGEVPPEPRPASPSDQLLTGLTGMLMAQRLFLANLRAAETAAEMLDDAVE